MRGGEMREISIKISTDKFVIRIVNGFKIIVGHNILLKDNLLNSINHMLNFEKLSQYDVDNSVTVDLLINSKKLNKNSICHYFYNQFWSLEKDIKLGTKSIAKDYIVASLPNIELSDDLRLLNQMIDIINSEYITNLDIDSDTQISINLSPLVGNSFVKLLDTQIISDNLLKNDRNIDLYDRLITFLKLVSSIAVNKPDKSIFITLHLPVIDNKILNILTEFKADNLITLVFTDILYTSINYEDLYIVNSKTIDLCFEIDLYNLILNKGFGTTLQECKEILENKLTLPTTNTNAYNTRIIDFINSL